MEIRNLLCQINAIIFFWVSKQWISVKFKLLLLCLFITLIRSELAIISSEVRDVRHIYPKTWFLDIFSKPIRMTICCNENIFIKYTGKLKSWYWYMKKNYSNYISNNIIIGVVDMNNKHAMETMTTPPPPTPPPCKWLPLYYQWWHPIWEKWSCSQFQ